MRRVLVANRGEIAVRIVRACRELGLESVVPYSNADSQSLATTMADETFCIGPAEPAKSYLSISSLILAAKATGCDAVHPGYGFLAENPAFAQACVQSGLIFVGPSADAIGAMGDKARARRLARELGVPTVPGQQGESVDGVSARKAADAMGYPILIKAAGGGGGRGMRIVWGPEDFEAAWTAAQSEARSAFGTDELYLERYLSHVRHVEIQVLADHHGHAIYLGDRDCSMQRRHQKLLEEAPAPDVSSPVREAMGKASLMLVNALGYTNAGTVEFLYDPHTEAFYFIEMNTRIQVEHPVTEVVTGIDLVRSQLLIAAGEPLPWRQSDVIPRGHAIECRVNAEDPRQGFRPVPGTLTEHKQPGGPGIRIDTHVFPGYTVPPYYDSLLAKLVVWDDSREHSVVRMRRALDEYRIDGVPTTIPFHRWIMQHPDFISGPVSTQWLETHALADWTALESEDRKGAADS